MIVRGVGFAICLRRILEPVYKVVIGQKLYTQEENIDGKVHQRQDHGEPSNRCHHSRDHGTYTYCQGWRTPMWNEEICKGQHEDSIRCVEEILHPEMGVDHGEGVLGSAFVFILNTVDSASLYDLFFRGNKPIWRDQTQRNDWNGVRVRVQDPFSSSSTGTRV